MGKAASVVFPQQYLLFCFKENHVNSVLFNKVLWSFWMISSIIWVQMNTFLAVLVLVNVKCINVNVSTCALFMWLWGMCCKGLGITAVWHSVRLSVQEGREKRRDCNFCSCWPHFLECVHIECLPAVINYACLFCPSTHCEAWNNEQYKRK